MVKRVIKQEVIIKQMNEKGITIKDISILLRLKKKILL